ncbi:MAG: HAMP domain-containing protein, partial [Schwartzia sp.]|nr:HAMP domain-containing protein [Schwartzia sp. (in: firmicutes)]
MNMKSWNIQRKILALLLSAGLLSFLALGAVSFFSMYSLSADAEESGRRMGESAADFTEEFATDLAKRRLLAVAEEKATNIDVYLIEVKNDISYIAQSMTAIFAHPETHNPRRLPQPQEKIIASGEAYIFFAPELQRRGISPALAEEIGLASNIADNISIMAGFYEGYQISCYIGSKNGYLICVDNMADGGNVAFTEDFFTTFDPRERPWYQAIAQSKTELGHGEAITTGTYLGADGYPVITHAAPYYDADGFAGVAGMGTSLESLCTYLVEEQRKSQYIIFALNQKGEVVFSSMKEGTLAAVAEHRDLRESEQKSLAFEAACMTAGLSDVGLVTIDGVEYYLAYAPIPSLGWSLGTLIERSTVIQPSVSAKEIILTQAADFLASVQSFFTDSLLRMAILLFVILAALVWGSRKAAERFVRPILALRDGVREIAMGNFDSKVEIQTGDEIGELADSVNAMSQELKAYVDNLSKVTAEKERIATELDLATNIQEGMLPSIFPTFSDRPDFALYATMHPAKEVGGDFYDFYMLDESHIAVTVADVSGKGVPAALFMVVAKTVLKNAAMAAAAAAYGVGGGLPDFAAI